MSPTKTILQHLEKLHHEQGPEASTAPSTIRGFDPEDPKHTGAMNRLLQDRLVNGARGPDGGLAVALNVGNMGAVKKALRPWYLSPMFWGPALVLGGLGTAGLIL